MEQTPKAAGNRGKGGGKDYLVKQANEQPVAFMTLLGKVLPTQINGSGENGELIHKVVREIVRPAHTDG